LAFNDVQLAVCVLNDALNASIRETGPLAPNALKGKPEIEAVDVEES
jgi:hypothetical protein